MPTPSTLLLFTMSSVVILLLPGPTMVYVVARALEHGRAAGLASVVGVQAGAAIHVVASALGLAAVLASSATAMTVVQVAGVAYLLHLGLSRLRRPPSAWATAPQRSRPRTMLFWQGLLVEALNPKTAVFFLAFLPQFVDPARGAVPLQAIVLGACFLTLALVTDCVCALGAAAFRQRLAERRAQAAIDRVAGVALLVLGAVAAVGGSGA